MLQSTVIPLFDKRGGEALSKNNRSSGCFCLQALWTILASQESVSNRSELRCLSWGELISPITEQLLNLWSKEVNIKH